MRSARSSAVLQAAWPCAQQLLQTLQLQPALLKALCIGASSPFASVAAPAPSTASAAEAASGPTSDAASSSTPLDAAAQPQVQQQSEAELDRQRSPASSGPWIDPDLSNKLPSLIPRAKPRPVPLLEALKLVKANAKAKFDETVEAHVRLKVDPRRGDQMVRGAAVLPHSTGKPVRIAVFAEGEHAQEAREAGADVVGDEELVAQILESKGKAIDFDRCLAHPDMMRSLVKLGKILGPKGLMPNPKVGTLTRELARAISETRRGRLEFKVDRTAIIHCPLGKVSFEPEKLYANMGALTSALMAAKPDVIKGGLPKYVAKVVVCSTMGRGVEVEPSSLLAAMDAAKMAM